MLILTNKLSKGVFQKCYKRNIFSTASNNVYIRYENEKCQHELTSGFLINLRNSVSPPPSQVKLEKNKNYTFPKFHVIYSRQDAVEHSLGVGLKKEDSFSDNFLNPLSPNFQVLPTFVLPLTNKLLFDVLTIWLDKNKTLHGEHFLKFFRPLEPEGEYTMEISVFDVLDKGKGALYCFYMNGSDKNGPIFNSEYQMYEMGTGGFGGAKINSNLTPIGKTPLNEKPDEIFEFQTVNCENYKDLSEEDLKISTYSSKHPRQYFSKYEILSSSPIIHGRYYFAAAVQTILRHFGNGDTKNFKSCKVRFTKPVYAGETLLFSTWKRGSRIHFEGTNKRSKENVLTGGYVDLNNFTPLNF